MHQLSKRFLCLAISTILCAAAAGVQQTAITTPSTRPDLDFPTVLYGVAYYNEYMPGDQAARLEKDVALMKAAGLRSSQILSTPSLSRAIPST